MHSPLRELTQRFFCLRWQDGLPPLLEQLCNRWGRGGKKLLRSSPGTFLLPSSRLSNGRADWLHRRARKKPPKNQKKGKKNLLESAKECGIYCVKVAVKSHRRKISALNEIFCITNSLNGQIASFIPKLKVAKNKSRLLKIRLFHKC